MNNIIGKGRSKILVIALIFSLLLSFTPNSFASSAYAMEESSTEQEVKDFVEDLDMYVTMAYTEKEQIEDFQQNKTEYEYVKADIGSQLAAKLFIADKYVTEQENAQLCFSVIYNGAKQRLMKLNAGDEINKSKIYKLYSKETSFASVLLLSTSDFPVGSKKQFTVRVGKYDAEKNDIVDYVDYNYNVSRNIVLQSLSVKADGININLSPAFNTTKDPYTTNYTAVVGDSKNIELTLKSSTAGVELLIGGKTVSSDASKGVTTECNLADYQDSDSGIAEIPITLKWSNEDQNLETTYTLCVTGTNLSPVIKKQPQNMTVEKGSKEPISVEVEEPEKGTITYQWYTDGRPIKNATKAEYLPPSVYAGTTKYSCRIKNTVGKNVFEIWSDTVDYNVNLTYPTAPEFVVNQYVDGNNGSDIFIQNETPRVQFSLMARGNDPIEGIPYEFEVYRNNKKSLDDATKIECEVSSTNQHGGGEKYFTYTLPYQDLVGSYYYFVKVKVTKDGKTDERVSKPLKLTYKDVKDVIKDLEGSGSSEDPFLVHNKNDLIKIKNYVEGKGGKNGDLQVRFLGHTVALAEDVELPSDWTPIGNVKNGGREDDRGISIQPFCGIFDGNGHTVTIADGGKPLFNYVRNATVKNLNIYGKHIKGYGLVDNYVVDYGETASYTNDPVKLRVVDIDNVKIKSGSKVLKSGFIGGYASGVNAVNIRNCVIEKGVTIGDDGSWGDLGDTGYGYGFVSDWFNHQDNIGSFGGAFNGTVANSVSYATVYGRKNVGGLIGMKGQSMGPCDIINSSFQGKIVATGDKVGGLVGAGYISGSATGTPTVEIHNSFVAADIEGNDKVGGLIGSEEGHVNFNDTGDSYGVKGALSVSDNHFYGNLTAKGDHVGGIIGYVHDFTKKNGDATNYYLDEEGKIPAIGGAVAGEMTGLEKYAAPVNAEGFADGTVLNKLNSSETSNRNWEQKEKYPVISDKAVVTGLSIEGEYKTDYVLGEDLDLTGLKLYANFSEGSKKELDIEKDGVTVSGFDKNKRGQQKITLQYKAFKAEFGVKVLKKVDPDNPAKITVTFTLLGDKVHGALNEGDTSHTLTDNNLETWIDKESITVPENSTVWDVIKAVDEKNEDVKFNNKGNYIDYIEYKGVKLAEFTNGENSGWMYTLNDKHPLLGIEEQYLDDGDDIVFHYTDDYTKEEGTDEWGPKPDPGEGENPGENPGNKPGGENPPTDKPSGGDTSTDKPSDKPSDKPADKPSDKPAAKPDADKKPATEEKPASPKTGDESNVVLLGMLLLASAGTTAGLARRKRNG